MGQWLDGFAEVNTQWLSSLVVLKEETEDLLSLHIILQFLKLILLLYLRIFSFIYPAQLCGLRSISKVVLFFNKFFICWASSIVTGTMNSEVNPHRHSSAPTQIRSAVVIQNRSSNHYGQQVGLSIMTHISARVAKMPMKARLSMRKKRKKLNLPIFLLPTQLLIQVQWWSYCCTHTLQISQWQPLLGIAFLQLKHNFLNYFQLFYPISSSQFLVYPGAGPLSSVKYSISIVAKTITCEYRGYHSTKVMSRLSTATLTAQVVRKMIGQVHFLLVGLYQILTLQYNFSRSQHENCQFSIRVIVLNLFYLAMWRGALFQWLAMYLSEPLMSSLRTMRVLPQSTASWRGVLPSVSCWSREVRVGSASRKAATSSLLVQAAQWRGVLPSWSRLLMSMRSLKYMSGMIMFFCAARWSGLRPDLVVSWQFTWCSQTRYWITSRWPLYDAQSRAVNPSLFCLSIQFLISWSGVFWQSCFLWLLDWRPIRLRISLTNSLMISRWPSQASWWRMVLSWVSVRANRFRSGFCYRNSCSQSILRLEKSISMISLSFRRGPTLIVPTQLQQSISQLSYRLQQKKTQQSYTTLHPPHISPRNRSNSAFPQTWIIWHQLSYLYLYRWY